MITTSTGTSAAQGLDEISGPALSAEAKFSALAHSPAVREAAKWLEQRETVLPLSDYAYQDSSLVLTPNGLEFGRCEQRQGRLYFEASDLPPGALREWQAQGRLEQLAERLEAAKLESRPRIVDICWSKTSSLHTIRFEDMHTHSLGIYGQAGVDVCDARPGRIRIGDLVVSQSWEPLGGTEGRLEAYVVAAVIEEADGECKVKTTPLEGDVQAALHDSAPEAFKAWSKRPRSGRFKFKNPDPES